MIDELFRINYIIYIVLRCSR